MLPDLVAWLAFLIEAGCLGRAAAYAALEQVWAHRVRRAGDAPLELHVPLPGPQERLRTAVWWSFGLVSLPAWLAAGAGRPLPEALLGPLGMLAVALAVGVGVCEASSAHPP